MFPKSNRNSLSIVFLFFLASACIDGGSKSVDVDGDGYDDAVDCNDGDAQVNPAGTEVCDGIDNDCDGASDNNAVDGLAWFADGDGDTYGNPAASTTACEQPPTYVSNADDCDDEEPRAWAGAIEVCDGVDNNCDDSIDDDTASGAPTWYADGDNDTYGDHGATRKGCEQPPGYVGNAGDCDDGDATVRPGASEVCDGIDNDCDDSVDDSTAADALTWYADGDVDDYGDPASATTACEPPPGFVANADDCDDNNDTIRPGATEVCDGADNDCDGTSDNDSAADAPTWFADGDADGYGDTTSPTTSCVQPAGYVGNENDCNDADARAWTNAGEVCDGADNDCDGIVDNDTATDAPTWYADADADGYGNSSISERACNQPAGFTGTSDDCDDTDLLIRPGATEICDGADNDCDGTVDNDTAVDALTWYGDGDGDGYGDLGNTTDACSQPSGFVSNTDDCDDSDAAINPGVADDPVDATDSDCDPTTDDLDGDGWSSALGDCDDTDAAVNPDAPEFLNNSDDNCNGSIDEEFGGSIAANLQTTAVAGVDYNYATSFVYPLGDGRAYTHASDTDGYYVCTEFREATSCYSITTHLGEDWNGEDGVDQGDPLLAVGDGVVVESTTGSAGWGQYIVIRHDAPPSGYFVLPDGTTTTTVVTMLAHIQNRQVAEGDAVTAGQQIAEIGPKAAGSSAEHLHFEIGSDLAQSYPGYGYSNSALGRVDPTEFLDANATVVTGPPTVGCGADYATIADAINAAADGDSIEICSGTYNENLTISGREITLVAADGPGTVTIDGGAVSSVLFASSSTLTMDGINVVNGYYLGGGGGLHLRDSDVTLSDCVISGNEAEGDGGGMFVLGGTLTMTDCEVSGNVTNNTTSTSGGGGMLIYDGAVVEITNCSITNNVTSRHGGGLFIDDADGLGTQVTITGGDVSDNDATYAGAIFTAWYADLRLISVDVQRNSATSWGGALYASSHSTMTVSGGTISDNSAASGGGVLNASTGSDVTFTSTTLTGNSASAGFASIFDSTVEVTSCVLTNTGHSVGGVEIDSLGDLISVSSTWTNSPGDVDANGIAYTYGRTASFTCDETGCR